MLLGGEPAGYSRKELNAWRRRVALVLQDTDDQLFAATVFEDVSFGPLNLGLSVEETSRRVEEALETLSISDLGDRPTQMLSGGQKRRVAIAGAVAMRPEVLLQDEPTAGLDEAGATQLIALLQGLVARGMTLVFFTHDVELAAALAGRVALFRRGQVACAGSASEVLCDRATLEQVRLSSPMLYDLALQARVLGLIPESNALPRSRSDFTALLQGWARR